MISEGGAVSWACARRLTVVARGGAVRVMTHCTLWWLEVELRHGTLHSVVARGGAASWHTALCGG